MLIKCGECGREISDQAMACPGCGAPIAKVAATGSAADEVSNGVQTIEQTSKKWKALQLGASVAIAAGIVFMMAGNMGFGAFLAFIGIITYIYGRAGAWWQNG
ncbi:MAG TPA: zinc ribbon domain-containing protein [Gammaproteobacteria bacterium]|nr:zinc ribbon domain-containing protein [Gammaproteobacteria bacterium]